MPIPEKQRNGHPPGPSAACVQRRDHKVMSEPYNIPNARYQPPRPRHKVSRSLQRTLLTASSHTRRSSAGWTASRSVPACIVSWASGISTLHFCELIYEKVQRRPPPSNGRRWACRPRQKTVFVCQDMLVSGHALVFDPICSLSFHAR
jgi:hypothetical protein